MSPSSASGHGVGGVDIPDLSRVAFFDGQRLAADDLNGAATVQRELRWLHNRSLHGWGIGLGFAVSGAKGDRQVTVGPGYAVDCRGREIILTATIQKGVPARADDGQGNPVIYYLVAAYPDDAELQELERRRGECGTDGAVRLEERAAIYWKAAGEQSVEAGLEIVLAQATVQNCQLAAPLSLAQRRSARPPTQPRFAAGATPTGLTPWELWRDEIDGVEQIYGVRTAVDTSAARFGGTPEYQAQLRGDRFFPGQSNLDLPSFLLEGVSFITEPSRQGFALWVALPRDITIGSFVQINPQAIFAQSGNLLELVREKWSVVWVGIEG